MNYFSSKKMQNDGRWFMICLIAVSFLLLGREIFKSWYLLYAVIIIVFFVVLILVLKKVKKNKEKRPAYLWDEFKEKYPIIMQYAPPKWMNPAEAWLLYNLKVEPTDLTSLIYRWVFEWLVQVETFKWKNSKKEYVKLIRIGELSLTCPSFESEIFDAIFAMWDIKIIEESFQLKYALMLEDLEYHWIRKWWITRSALSKKWKYFHVFLSVLLFFCVFLILIDAYIMFSTIFWIIFSALLFLFVVVSWYIYWWWNLVFTDRWAELASQIIWYRNFIKSCDEDKIKLFLKQDSLFIDRTLPFATAFGLETEFLHKISPLKSDWNAKYVRWKKVPTRTKVLRMMIWSNEDSYF